MGDSSYGIFLASVGCIAGWIGFWAAVASIVRAHNRNAPPGSRAKRVMDAINIILVVPLLPLVPILAICKISLAMIRMDGRGIFRRDVKLYAQPYIAVVAAV